MKRISLEEIQKNICSSMRHKVQESEHTESEYSMLYRRIMEQIEAGILKPVKASGTNGKKPALYLEYWIQAVQPEEEQLQRELLEELQYRLIPTISLDYYQKHLDSYRQDRQWVQMLNEYLKEKKGKQTAPISLNERSFEIWKREKFLQKEQGRKILKRCGMAVEDLQIYETSEPLAYYVHTRNTPQNILIIENKDTFYSMRRALLEGQETILGKAFGTLVYGAGKGILRSFQDFTLCVEPFMQQKDNRLYYFGDLDYEGILIFERLAESFQGYQEIFPFTEAYNRMMEKAGEWERLPDTKDGQNRNIGRRFFQYFHSQQEEGMMQLLESGKYIPQEILNIKDYQNIQNG